MYRASCEPPKKPAWRLALAIIGFIALVAQAADLPPAAPVVALPDETTFGVRVEQGDLATVGAWLDVGLDPNFEGDRIGTGLMIAAWYGDIAMMELFVKRGADVNRTNRFHEQALMQAVWKGHREAAAWLIEHGARINREGNEWSALHYAAYAGHDDVANFLVQQGADVSAKSTNGSTALMMAAHEGREKIAAMLLEAGADSRVKNDLGEDALTWAMRYEHLTIAKMVSSASELAEAAVRPKESWGGAVATIPAPAEVENILQQERLAHAIGKSRILSDEDYRKVLEKVAKMKPPTVKSRPPKRMSITAEKGNMWKQWAEFEFGD